jgi:hypothetical protein
MAFTALVLVLPLSLEAASKMGELDFENSLSDPYGYLKPEVGGGGDPNGIVTYVPGHTGYAARSSHSADVEGNGLVIRVGPLGNYWPASDELYIRWYVKYESNYDPGCGHSNVKWLWTLDDPHMEIWTSGWNLATEEVNFAWQFDGWDAGNTAVKWSDNTPFRRGQWHEMEIYMRLSSGSNHQNADGIMWIKIDGITYIEGYNVITGKPQRMHSPSIKATCDCPSGKGWWQIDDYEVWDGIPDGEASHNTPPSPPTGLSLVPPSM